MLRLLVISLLFTRLHAAAFAPPPIPVPDRVEITPVDTAANVPPAVLSTKRSRAFATLVNRLKWLGQTGGCDKAQYELKFYAGGKIVADRLICFNCGCYAPTTQDPHPDAPILTFDIKDANTARLQKSIEQLFPVRK